MRRKDHIFYSQLFLMIFFLAVILRLLLMFVGIRVDVPYFDQIIIFLWRTIGIIFTTFGDSISFRVTPQ